ncbi:hypothetical protein BE25_0056 [Staphylococcus phage vB_SepM_BE25]|nr:hypothetical protein BE25_0056 [Staphylococcus phage vB_SepM_BE25]
MLISIQEYCLKKLLDNIITFGNNIKVQRLSL